jgi:hypothetical protein
MDGIDDYARSSVYLSHSLRERADVLAKHRRLEHSIIDERRIFRSVAASNVIGALLTNTFR